MITEENAVLIVDDRAANRYTTAHALKRAGFQVIEAATGKEALELSRLLPAVIILDVKLPDILGYEVCRRIKANAQTKHIPVLQLSSSFLTNESKLYALESGADSYLIQPADPVVLVATVKSLVRLHRAESSAQLAAKQWQSTFDALNEGVALVNSAGIVQRCNRAMTEILGKAYGELENRTCSELIWDCFGLFVSLTSERVSKEVQSGDRFFRLSLNPIIADEASAGSIFIVADTTQQKLAEQAILISERLAATGRMAHTIAHEINNPLEAITNLVYLVQTSLDDREAAQQYIDSAASEVARVSRIARQILSFNRESFSPIEIDIAELIDDVLALNNRAIVDKNLRIRKTARGAQMIEGFPAQLRQVFSNLIRNAVEASFPNSEIRINISPSGLRRNLADPAVRVTIADHGVGIAPQHLGRIFDAFFTTKALKGSGVGLWLSSSIIHEHGGRLRVRSSIERSHSGTSMSVVLPCRLRKSADIDDVPAVIEALIPRAV
ncbi:Chemotaxis protein methyltransferase CheR [Acidisarcina polymorpha]|uniref:histidine kinase n=1 Tax=Acidisarcina polymorpha TaxID=2211140 RepID=A0A2Z5G658_9BACT|nr:ATP-binding protein [Acidisarcina polymorpha]AXC14470.1 Chemotaxis protein methyltransferase CheR [Acidisarcina polymorpha]